MKNCDQYSFLLLLIAFLLPWIGPLTQDRNAFASGLAGHALILIWVDDVSTVQTAVAFGAVKVILSTMPSARTHDLITVFSGAALTPLAYSWYLNHAQLAPPTALACSLWLGGAHLVSGIMFSPDLDLDSAIDNRWGVLFWIWRPYMWLIPHRAFWSHSLVIAPLLRLGYFAGVVYGFLFGLVWLLGQLGLTAPAYHREVAAWVGGLVAIYPNETWAFLIGFCTGSAAHTIADWLVTKGNWLLGGYGRRLRRRYRNHDQWVPPRERMRR